MGFPKISTFRKAVQNDSLATFPGNLASSQIGQNLHFSVPTELYYMTQEYQGTQSTKKIHLPSDDIPPPEVDKITELEDNAPRPIARKTNYMSAKCVPATGKIYSDPTGRFVATSISGNRYLLVIYDYDSNTIHAEGMPSSTKESQVTTYNTIIKLLKKRGCNPKFLILDNVTSDFLEEFLDDEDVTFELVPPYLHRRNYAEREIRTFKEHFIAIFSGTDPTFPIILWDKLTTVHYDTEFAAYVSYTPTIICLCSIMGIV